jgi:hypothetical protein
MEFVFGGVLIVAGAMLIGLAYHNHVADAWQVVVS